MLLVKKGKPKIKIGSIVEILSNDIKKIEEEISVTKCRLPYYQKYILIDKTIINGNKLARLIKIESGYSTLANSVRIKTNKKKLIYVRLDSVIESKSNFNDIYNVHTPDVYEYLLNTYGITIEQRL